MFIVRLSFAVMLTACLLSSGLLFLNKQENLLYKLALPRVANTIVMPWGLGAEALSADSGHSQEAETL